MKKSALTITLINGFVTAIQIIGQIIVARLFGARIQLDAFVSAVTIPTILTTVIAATLSDAFLPIFKKKQIDNEDSANKYFFRIAFIISIMVFIITFGIDLFSTKLLGALFGVRGPGFVTLTGTLMKYMVYTLPFTVLGTFSNAYLYSKKQFLLPSIAYFLGSIVNLSIIIILSPSIGIISMVVGFVTAVILQFFLVFPYRIRSYMLTAIKSINGKNMKLELSGLLSSWAPLIISTLILGFSAVLARFFSAKLPEGYIVYVNLVTKLFGGLVGIMTIGIQTVFFPHLVELIHTHNFEKAKLQVNKAKLYGLILTVGTIFIIVFFAPFFMKLLLTGGKFSSKNVEILISLFPYFIIPSIGWGISQIFFQPIIAIGKQHLLTFVNIGAVFLSWISATYAYEQFGGMMAISVGLIVLSFTGIIGAEIIWRKQFKQQSSLGH
ncbi:MAG: Integral membrane protein MviN [Candidatus Levybacteria bacterium GW2011_GWA2_37_36]|nr:MAG: Integral membrane protein MviN [Candidatus Levybacteria bacterium GW2011_GWA2_37_36]